MLYRPSYHRQGLSTVTRHNRTTEVILTNFSSTVSPTPTTPTADPPPKYTPPPSYSTATGARIARMLRESFRRSVRRLGARGGAEARPNKPAPPPDYAHVVIETARHTTNTNDDVYIEPHDSIMFEMRPTASNTLNSELGAYSLDLSLPTLQRRSIRRNNSDRSQQQQQQPEHPPGRVVAVGVGALHRAGSEAVLMDEAEPINVDSGSELYTALSEISINVCDTNDDDIETVDDDCERVRSSAEMEAVNIHVRQDSHTSTSSQVVTIDMDTSTSVI